MRVRVDKVKIEREKERPAFQNSDREKERKGEREKESECIPWCRHSSAAASPWRPAWRRRRRMKLFQGPNILFLNVYFTMFYIN